MPEVPVVFTFEFVQVSVSCYLHGFIFTLLTLSC